MYICTENFYDDIGRIIYNIEDEYKETSEERTEYLLSNKTTFGKPVIKLKSEDTKDNTEKNKKSNKK